MSEFQLASAEMTAENKPEELLEKLHTYFAGKIVRKDLTKKIKEGAMFRFMYWNTFLGCTVLPGMRTKSRLVYRM